MQNTTLTQDATRFDDGRGMQHRTARSPRGGRTGLESAEEPLLDSLCQSCQDMTDMRYDQVAAPPLGFARLRDVRDRDRPRRWTGATTTEARLFEAAELALAEHGYAGLRVQDLCDYAGIGRSAFYHYFSSASAVVVAMLARAMDDIYDECAGFLRPSAAAADWRQIEAGLRAGWSAWDRHRVVFMATSQHWPDVPELRELWTEIVGRFTGALAHAIDRARAAGDAPAGMDSTQLAALLVWSVERHAFVSGMEIDRRLAGSEESVIDAVCEFWRQAIYGQSAGESPASR